MFSNWQMFRDQAQVFSFQGQELAWWQSGSAEDGKPVLLLIHGFPTSSWDWHKLWSSLAENYRLIALDMLGFGFSAKPRGHDYRIAEQADSYEALLAHLGVSRCHILAHDYGDTVAQELLARQQEGAPGALDIQSCCLLNGGLFPETHRATKMQKLLHSPLGPLLARLMNEGSFRRSFRGVFGAQSQPSDEELQAYWACLAANGGTGRIVHRLIRYITERRQNRARWVGALEHSVCPLRVICGAEDPVSGAHMAARYQEVVASADVLLLPGIGHYPQAEAPEAVLAGLAEFHQGLS